MGSESQNNSLWNLIFSLDNQVDASSRRQLSNRYRLQSGCLVEGDHSPVVTNYHCRRGLRRPLGYNITGNLLLAKQIALAGVDPVILHIFSFGSCIDLPSSTVLYEWAASHSAPHIVTERAL